MRPAECRWCGYELTDDTTHDTVYACGSVQHPRSGRWSQSAGCVEIMRSRKRIQRALEKIKSSKRWSVEKIAKTPIEYYIDPDGWIAQASDMDEVARILEGDADDEQT